MSPAEEEFTALSSCIGDVIWLRADLLDLYMTNRLHTTVFQHILEGISWIDKAQKLHYVKLVFIRYHFVYSSVRKRNVAIIYTPCLQSKPDSLKKVLAEELLDLHGCFLGRESSFGSSVKWVCGIQVFHWFMFGTTLCRHGDIARQLMTAKNILQHHLCMAKCRRTLLIVLPNRWWNKYCSQSVIFYCWNSPVTVKVKRPISLIITVETLWSVLPKFVQYDSYVLWISSRVKYYFQKRDI